MIEQVLIICWTNDDSPPESLLANVESWRRYAPQFAVHLWTRSPLAERFGPELLEVNLSPVHLSHLLRVRFARLDGCVYVDGDVQALPGAGDVLAAACESASLLAGCFHRSLVPDTTPFGAVAGLPGFEQIERHAESFLPAWHRYLREAGIPATLLPGFNAPAEAAGVFAIHRRGSLRPAEHLPPRPAITVRSAESHRRAEARRQAAAAFTAGVQHRTALAQMLPPGAVGVEVGVHRAAFAAELLARRSDLTLHLIDPWKTALEDYLDFPGRNREDDYRAALAAIEPFGERAVVHRRDSLAAFTAFEPASLDFVYLDANHARPHIDRDLDCWFSRLKPGGLFAGHDLTGPWGAHVRPAVSRFAFHHGLITSSTRDSPASWYSLKPVE